MLRLRAGGLCTAHKDGLCVPCQEGEELEGREEEWGGGGNGVSIEQCAQCLLPVGTTSIPREYRHGFYKRNLKNCFQGWSLVRPSMSLRHMHHCMFMNALEQGLLGLEAAKASGIEDF